MTDLMCGAVGSVDGEEASIRDDLLQSSTLSSLADADTLLPTGSGRKAGFRCVGLQCLWDDQ